MEWWQNVYPIHQKHPTFFAIGMQYQFGPYPPVCDMQSRSLLPHTCLPNCSTSSLVSALPVPSWRGKMSCQRWRR